MFNPKRRAAALLLALGMGIATMPVASAAGADAARLAAAQREGQLLWYTTLLEEAWRPVKEGFERRHPGIEVRVVRAAHAPASAD